MLGQAVSFGFFVVFSFAFFSCLSICVMCYDVCGTQKTTSVLFFHRVDSGVKFKLPGMQKTPLPPIRPFGLLYSWVCLLVWLFGFWFVVVGKQLFCVCSKSLASVLFVTCNPE